MRKRWIRTEKHISILAQKNPEMVDEKAKEIISRIDTKNLKRNTQLQSLGNVGECVGNSFLNLSLIFRFLLFF